MSSQRVPKPSCKSCSAKRAAKVQQPQAKVSLPTKKAAEKNIVTAPATTKTNKVTIPAKAANKDAPKLRQAEDINLDIIIDNCGGGLSFPPWTIEKEAADKPVPCVNQGDDAIVDFKVTIRRPVDANPTLCWFAHFKATNNGDEPLVFSLFAILQRTPPQPPAQVGPPHSVTELVLINTSGQSQIVDGTVTLQPGDSVTGTVCDCTEIDCETGAAFGVVIIALTQEEEEVRSCECIVKEVAEGDCVDDRCYFFTDSASCGDDHTDSVLVSVDETFSENECTDLHEVELATNGFALAPPGDPFVPVRPGGEAPNTLLICPFCLGDNGEVVLNVRVTCEEFACGEVISNTACLTLALEDGDDFIPSTRACDIICDDAKITPECKTPQVCCEVESDRPNICVCKTSKVIQQPSVEGCAILSQGFYFRSGKDLLREAFANTTFYFVRIIDNDTQQLVPSPYCLSLQNSPVTNILPTVPPPDPWPHGTTGKSCPLTI